MGLDIMHGVVCETCMLCAHPNPACRKRPVGAGGHVSPASHNLWPRAGRLRSRRGQRSKRTLACIMPMRVRERPRGEARRQVLRASSLTTAVRAYAGRAYVSREAVTWRLPAARAADAAGAGRLSTGCWRCCSDHCAGTRGPGCAIRCCSYCTASDTHAAPLASWVTRHPCRAQRTRHAGIASWTFL